MQDLNNNTNSNFNVSLNEQNSPKKFFNYWKIISIFLFIIIIFLVMMFFTIARDSIDSQECMPCNELQSPQTTVINESTQKWKTYQSDDFNISFKYPHLIYKTQLVSQVGDNDLLNLLVEGKYSDVVESADIIPIMIFYGNENFARQDSYFGGFNWTQQKNEVLNNLEIGHGETIGREIIVKKRSFTIGDQKAYKYEVVPITSMGGESYIGVTLVNDKESYLFVFHPDESEITEQQFDDLIESVTFVNEQ